MRWLRDFEASYFVTMRQLLLSFLEMTINIHLNASSYVQLHHESSFFF